MSFGETRSSPTTTCQSWNRTSHHVFPPNQSFNDSFPVPPPFKKHPTWTWVREVQGAAGKSWRRVWCSQRTPQGMCQSGDLLTRNCSTNPLLPLFSHGKRSSPFKAPKTRQAHASLPLHSRVGGRQAKGEGSPFFPFTCTPSFRTPKVLLEPKGQ